MTPSGKSVPPPEREVSIGPAEEEEPERCEEILRALPGWFGIEEAIVRYRRDIEAMETLVARLDGRVVGFLTLKQHNPHTSEIQVMAVGLEHQGRGVGRALILRAEELLRARSVEFLEVKTLGPSRPDRNYERTRGFYLKMGFLPVEENHLWGEKNPCLVQIKHLACS